MTVLGFHASHEQVHPAALLEAVQHAEQVGFTAVMCSDHFSPWSVWQGHSAVTWSWLGATLQATDLPFGVVDRVKLSTLPPSPLLGAAVSEQTAGGVAGWADGLITVAHPHDDLRAAEQVLPQLSVTQEAAA